MADRQPTIAIDFDGTLAEHKWPDWGEWKPGAPEAVRELLDAGCKVMVFSVRCNTHDPITGTERSPADYFNTLTRMRSMLDDAGLSAVSIFQGNKPLFDILVDDRTIWFPGRPGSWKVMPRKILARLGRVL